jgi:hypothetical protein
MLYEIIFNLQGFLFLNNSMVDTREAQAIR